MIATVRTLREQATFRAAYDEVPRLGHGIGLGRSPCSRYPEPLTQQAADLLRPRSRRRRTTCSLYLMGAFWRCEFSSSS